MMHEDGYYKFYDADGCPVWLSHVTRGAEDMLRITLMSSEVTLTREQCKDMIELMYRFLIHRELGDD